MFGTQPTSKPAQKSGNNMSAYAATILGGTGAAASTSNKTLLGE
jgi:hypothetical protein